eukprot:CAMPEP_0197539358 /NCGR_PEP_ID=MMETSP1318-20131121/62467_1 /TAXON_ID=552666 /ORGANISM="Partenskyella glossopodia, Strain RCC365" /LENGTH=63 /DNA_ID=CAMNT_0043098049 /DNA_START=28 /DNA_END=216 /DNA_ORIENTATION=+
MEETKNTSRINPGQAIYNTFPSYQNYAGNASGAGSGYSGDDTADTYATYQYGTSSQTNTNINN